MASEPEATSGNSVASAPAPQQTMNGQTTSRMAQLAADIARNTATLDAYYKDKGLSAPSFDAQNDAVVESADHDVRAAQEAIVTASEELKALAMGGEDWVRYMAWQSTDMLCLQAINHFDFASKFAPGTTTTYAALAAATSVPEPTVRRFVRYAVRRHIFAEPSKDVVAHTPGSAALNQNPLLRAWVGLHTEDLWPGFVKTVDAVETWPESEEINHTGMSLANGTDEPFFAIFAKDRAKLQRYVLAMSSWAEGRPSKVDFLAQGWDWGKLGEATVVDLGGNLGYASATIAKYHPSLKFVIQELPHVVDKANANKPTLPAEVRDRIEFMAHDFFTPQTVQADVYFFRWIFHNWPDKYAVQMLRNLVPAMKKGARVLINEGMLSEPGEELDEYQERIMRTMDLTMLASVNAKSRESSVWRKIFARADSRFKYLGASKAKGSLLWAIEAVWDPDGDAADGVSAVSADSLRS